MLRIAICDDMEAARLNLRMMLYRILNREEPVIYEFSSGEGAVKWLEKHSGEVDLFFLDIEMGKMDGMETARRIRQTDQNLALVFVTGYADYVFDGYQVGALDYLMKPVKEEKLRGVLQRLSEQLIVSAPQYYSFQNTQGTFRILKKDILYFYSDRRQVVLVTKSKEYPFYAKLDEVQQAIGKGFVRIHQRYLVHAEQVDFIETDRVTIGEISLPISRAYKNCAHLELSDAMLEKGSF